MLKDLSEDLNSIKKIQSETKGTLVETKNNLQGNNNRVDEDENASNDLEHKGTTTTTKQPIRTTVRKKNLKK